MNAPWRAPRGQDDPPSTAPTVTPHGDAGWCHGSALGSALLTGEAPARRPHRSPSSGDRGAAGTGDPHDPATGRPPFPGRSLRRGAGGAGRARPGLRGRRGGTGSTGSGSRAAGCSRRAGRGRAAWPLPQGWAPRGPETRLHSVFRNGLQKRPGEERGSAGRPHELTHTPVTVRRPRPWDMHTGPRTTEKTPAGGAAGCQAHAGAPPAHPLRQGPPFSTSERKTARPRRGARKVQDQDPKSDLTPRPALPTVPSRRASRSWLTDRVTPGLLCRAACRK